MEKCSSVRHVAIIMDGNGRWAEQRGLPRSEGHRQGAETVSRVLEGALDLGIEYLTLYAFSTENWKRNTCWGKMRSTSSCGGAESVPGASPRPPGSPSRRRSSTPGGSSSAGKKSIPATWSPAAAATSIKVCCWLVALLSLASRRCKSSALAIISTLPGKVLGSKSVH